MRSLLTVPASSSFASHVQALKVITKWNKNRNILGGNAIPPNNIRTRGNGDIRAFPEIGLQKTKSLQKSFKI